MRATKYCNRIRRTTAAKKNAKCVVVREEPVGAIIQAGFGYEPRPIMGWKKARKIAASHLRSRWKLNPTAARTALIRSPSRPLR
jgi:hypothetical protein